MRGTEVSEFIDLAYIWQERATEAEAEAADWRKVAKQHMEKVCGLEAELVKLRKVADAAREFFEGTGCKPKECKKCDPKYINFCERSRIGQALAELDKEGEKGTYKCQNCQNLVESEYTNRLFCSYHSEGEYQHETFLDDYCNYFESKKEGER